jgi:hypothetical protein
LPAAFALSIFQEQNTRSYMHLSLLHAAMQPAAHVFAQDQREHPTLHQQDLHSHTTRKRQGLHGRTAQLVFG